MAYMPAIVLAARSTGSMKDRVRAVIQDHPPFSDVARSTISCVHVPVQPGFSRLSDAEKETLYSLAAHRAASARVLGVTQARLADDDVMCLRLALEVGGRTGGECCWLRLAWWGVPAPGGCD